MANPFSLCPGNPRRLSEDCLHAQLAGGACCKVGDRNSCPDPEVDSLACGTRTDRRNSPAPVADVPPRLGGSSEMYTSIPASYHCPMPNTRLFLLMTENLGGDGSWPRCCSSLCFLFFLNSPFLCLYGCVSSGGEE